MDTFDNTVKKTLSIFDNQYVTAAVSLILILYAGLVAPKLPPTIIAFLDNPIIKILFFFLIIYISRKNATMAIIASIAVFITLITISRYQFDMSILRNMGSQIVNIVKPNEVVQPVPPVTEAKKESFDSNSFDEFIPYDAEDQKFSQSWNAS